MLYDFLVIRQLVPVNPTTSVRGPKYVVKRGKTPVWSREDTKKLLESIPRDDLAGRAIAPWSPPCSLVLPGVGSIMAHISFVPTGRRVSCEA